jgi:hypothetical protein
MEGGKDKKENDGVALLSNGTQIVTGKNLGAF